MDKLEIEFKESSTGTYSPWHLDLTHKYNVSLLCTADIGYFVKVGEDIYKIYYQNDYYNLYNYVCDLEEKNNKGELSNKEVLSLLDIALTDTQKISKCEPLDLFKEYLIRLKNREDERKAAHTTSI